MEANKFFLITLIAYIEAFSYPPNYLYQPEPFLALGHDGKFYEVTSIVNQDLLLIPYVPPKYFLYNKFSKKDPIPLDIGMMNLNRIDLNAPIKVIAHDWQESKSSDSVQTLKRAYLDSYDMNVIIVDWKADVNDSYFAAVSFTRPTSVDVAEFLDLLTSHLHIAMCDIHLLGFGLGAHMLGVAAKHVRRGHVGTITGLDPTLVLVDINHRLDWSDADYVEVVHTSHRSGLISYELPMGHADFYINDGLLQPGCGDILCSHSRAYELYADAIRNPRRYQGVWCQDYLDLMMERCPNYGYRHALGGLIPEVGYGLFRVITSKDIRYD